MDEPGLTPVLVAAHEHWWCTICGHFEHCDDDDRCRDREACAQRAAVIVPALTRLVPGETPAPVLWDQWPE